VIPRYLNRPRFANTSITLALQPGNAKLEYPLNAIRTVKGKEVLGSYSNSYVKSTTMPIKPFTSPISVYILEESITQALIYKYIVFNRFLASSSNAFSAP